MKKFYLIIIIVIIALNTQSCKDKETIIYEKEILLNNNLWAKNEIIKFNFNINDTSKIYSCLIKIKIDTNYTYNKFIFSTTLKTPDGSYRQSGFETQIDEDYKQKFIDKEEGVMIIEKEIYNNVKFKEKGEYEIGVMHNLPQDIFNVRSVEVKVIEGRG
jgi:gliding motility-associated lipoprotein GldH